MAYVNFNDERIPLGKRKQAYVRWAISKGTDKIAACRQANEKFGFMKKGKVVLVIHDYGRTQQRSFRGVEECFDNANIDRRRYEQSEYIMCENQFDGHPNIWSSYGFMVGFSPRIPLEENEKHQNEELEKEITKMRLDGFKIVHIDAVG